MDGQHVLSIFRWLSDCTDAACAVNDFTTGTLRCRSSRYRSQRAVNVVDEGFIVPGTLGMARL